MSATYAKSTRVPVRQSRHEIEAVLAKYGADKFGFSIEPGRAIVMFQNNNRTVRMTLPLPVGHGPKIEQEERSKWRSFLLCIKAKMEAVANRIETFDEAWLAHIVTDDGSTAYERIKSTLPALPPPVREHRHLERR